MDLTELTVDQAAQTLREGDVTAEDYAEALLARAADHSDLNAFITLNAEHVRAAARAADERRAAGGTTLRPLHGVPLALKDNIDPVDLPTTGGTPALRNHRPQRNAHVAQSLLDAGAIVLGKTNMHELAYGITNNNKSYHSHSFMRSTPVRIDTWNFELVFRIFA